MLVAEDDRPAPHMTEITDLPEAPDSSVEGLGEALSGLLERLDPQGRWALLLSRPGPHLIGPADRAWAAAFYDMFRLRPIAHLAVHLATDSDIVPIPIDEVTGYLRAS